jgi:hypothetical protein
MKFIYKEYLLKWNTTVPYRAHQNLLKQYFIYQLTYFTELWIWPDAFRPLYGHHQWQ